MRLADWPGALGMRLRALFRRADVERDLDEELRYHIERQIEANVASGLTPQEARQAALRAMGGIERRKDECRDQRRGAWLDDVSRDLRHAMRVLRRGPIFTAVAVCLLALGIGANTAIFQLIDVVRLRSLPVADPHELAEVRVAGVRDFGVADGFNSEITYPLWEEIRAHQQAFSGMFAWGKITPLIGRGADAQRAGLLVISGELFSVLGIAPERGRLIAAGDDRRGCGAGPVVISHAFWQRHFGGRESAIGSTLTILDQPFTVVGVTPAHFTGFEIGKGFDLAVPLCSLALWGNALDQRNYWWLTVMGRLKPDWSLVRAGDHMRAISPGLFDATTPTGYSAESTARYRAFRLRVLPAGRGVSRLRTNYGTSLWVLLGMTGLVLLITCGNLATLMLARAGARAREITVRVALGASRRRIVSQMLVESLLVGAIGATTAVPVALLSSSALVAFLSTEANPMLLDLGLDWRIITFTTMVSVLTVILFGLVPALRMSLVSPIDAMRQSARGLTMDRRRSAFQRTLVVGQIAVSLVLVVSALLFVRSFRNLTDVNTGFDQNGIRSIAFIDLASAKLPLDQRVEFQRRLTEEIRSTPGIVAAASSTHVPLNGASWSHAFRLPSIAAEERRSSRWAYVGPGYFETLRIPFRLGRDINPFDTDTSRRVLVVNDAFVREHLKGVNPIGTTLRTFSEPGYPETTYEIVGVVEDTKYSDLREGMPSIAFAPISQHPNLRPWASVIVRQDASVPGVMTEVRRRVARLNPGIAIQSTDLKRQVQDRLIGERTMAWLAGAFGVIAMTLASVGLYGVVAYLVSSRRNEIGIRLSLGSSRAQVIALVLRDTLWLLALGVVLGVPIALAVMNGVRPLVFGLPASSVDILTAAALVLGAAAGLAGCVPAWRASRLNPTTALRCD